MTRGWFITGTDTGVGKTLVAELLLEALARAGYRVAGMKPVASGAQVSAGTVRSADAERLIHASNVLIDYATANPYAFVRPVAPHLAAAAAGIAIDPTLVARCFAALAQRADRIVVEGVGGWRVPIDGSRTMADVARVLELPVIMVVGLRLGCLNHALLSFQAICQDDSPFVGWVANGVDDTMEFVEENIATLSGRLGAPPLVTIPYGPAENRRRSLGDALLGALIQKNPD